MSSLPAFETIESDLSILSEAIGLLESQGRSHGADEERENMRDHVDEVARRAARLAGNARASLKRLSLFTAALHDLGISDPAFQDRSHRNKDGSGYSPTYGLKAESAEHSLPEALAFAEAKLQSSAEIMERMVAESVAWHRGFAERSERTDRTQLETRRDLESLIGG